MFSVCDLSGRLLQVLPVTWGCNESLSTLRSSSSAVFAVEYLPMQAELQSDLLQSLQHGYTRVRKG